MNLTVNSSLGALRRPSVSTVMIVNRQSKGNVTGSVSWVSATTTMSDSAQLSATSYPAILSAGNWSPFSRNNGGVHDKVMDDGGGGSWAYANVGKNIIKTNIRKFILVINSVNNPSITITALAKTLKPKKMIITSH